LLDGIINEVSDKTSYASRLILIHWWFCDWELFKSKCLWASTFGYTFTDLRTNGFESLKIQYRANCLQLIESGQIRDRAGLLKREYKMFRWLRANDSKWLDKYLPILNKNNQSALF